MSKHLRNLSFTMTFIFIQNHMVENQIMLSGWLQSRRKKKKQKYVSCQLYIYQTSFLIFIVKYRNSLRRRWRGFFEAENALSSSRDRGGPTFQFLWKFWPTAFGRVWVVKYIFCGKMWSSLIVARSLQFRCR